MKYPKLQTSAAYRETLDLFLGYHNGAKIAQGEFAQMENMTSDQFPLLSPREPRGIYARPGNPQGLIARDTLCYVDGSKLVLNGYAVEMHLSTRAQDCPKQLVSMGAYIIILPDRKYINTALITEQGSLDAVVTTGASVTFSPADMNGTVQLPQYLQPEEPKNPANMALWMDTSVEPHCLMQWSAGAAMWTPVAESFVRIDAPGIGSAFRQYDGVTLSGPAGQAKDLEGSTVIWLRGEDFLLVPGLLDQVYQQAAPITVSRKMPDMDLVIENGNRLWGCRYGISEDGQPINEIYASKLGDFRNWNCFMGLSTDSYRVSLGADGPFTGAAAHMGYPLFFRENCLHKIYGSFPANFQVQTTPCRGVQRGSEKSLALVGEQLFYKSTHGVCAYDGALPVDISANLGMTHYTDAAAGAHGSKYYISMKAAGGEYHLFVYDRARNLWHREDSLHVLDFCSCREELYLLCADKVIRTVFGTGIPEAAVSWMAQTGELETEAPDNKYLCRMTLRIWLGQDSTARVLVRYDGEPVWEEAARLRGDGLGSFTLPLRVRRCDHLALRLEGTGPARLHSLAKTIEEGSDVF